MNLKQNINILCQNKFQAKLGGFLKSHHRVPKLCMWDYGTQILRFHTERNQTATNSQQLAGLQDIFTLLYYYLRGQTSLATILPEGG